MNTNKDEEILAWSPDDMLEIILHEPDDFLKVKETLSRIGISSKREENVLYQSCHILHKRGKYFLVHFKELFILDGKPSSLSQNDIERRNTIAILLSDWGLISIVNLNDIKDKTCSLKQIKIISHKEKINWILTPKYNIGNVKDKRTNSKYELP